MALNVLPTNYYWLTNSYAGANFPLAVIPSSPDLLLYGASKGASSLSWQFLSAQDPAKYNICTTYAGKSYCLDVFGNDKTTPHLATPAFVTGQQWIAIPSSGNTYKFSNDYSGSGYFLDMTSDTKQGLMSMGDHTGQYWTLNSEGEQPDQTSTSSTTMITVVKTTTTDSSSSSTTIKAASIPTESNISQGTSTSSTVSSGSGGISKDGKLGMAVGLGVGIPTIIVAILAWLFPCK